MRKSFIPIILVLLITMSCGQSKTESENEAATEEMKSSIEANKKIAANYHDLNPEDIDVIFMEDFIGHGENHNWDLESHRGFLSNESFKADSISLQIAEGDWVATMFTRTMDYQGNRITVPVMHFKRIENGKIAELWEYYDYTEESEE
jgi:hypothetical protein